MERTKIPTEIKIPVDKKILWKKTTGTFRLPDRRLIKAGQTFLAALEDIPAAFRDTIMPVDPASLAELENKEIPLPPIVPSYRKEKRGESNWWNVVDGEGKVLNEKALREEQADDYLNSLK